MAYRLKSNGLNNMEIARQIGCGDSLLVYMFQGKISSVGVASVWTPRPGALTIDDREQYLVWVFALAHSLSAIARGLGRSPSTVTREVAANDGREGHRAWRAHERSQFRSST